MRSLLRALVPPLLALPLLAVAAPASAAPPTWQSPPEFQAAAVMTAQLTFDQGVVVRDQQAVRLRERDTGRFLKTNVDCGTFTVDAQGNASKSGVNCLESEPSRTVVVSTSEAMVAGQHYEIVLGDNLTNAAGERPTPSVRAIRGKRTSTDADALTRRTGRILPLSSAVGGSYVAARATSFSEFVVAGGSQPTVLHVVKSPFGGIAELETTAGKAAIDLYAPSVQTARIPLRFARCSGFGCITSFSLTATGRRNPASRDTLVTLDALTAGGRTADLRAPQLRWNGFRVPGATGGAAMVTDFGGSSFALTFRGTVVDWYVPVGEFHGRTRVLLDGRQRMVTDDYAPRAGLVRRRMTVPDGVHTLTIVVDGTKRSDAFGTYAGVDRIVVG